MLGFFADSFVTATLVRKGPGHYSTTSGLWIPGTSVSTSILVIPPQPVRENDLVPLPEGETVSNYRAIWSETPLRTRQGDDDADGITYAGKSYKVFQTDDRSVDGAFYRSIIREVRA